MGTLTEAYLIDTTKEHLDITKEDLKILLRHLRPVCQFCGCYSGSTDQARPATRISFVPEMSGYYREGFFCDEHSFKEPEFEEGFSEEYKLEFPVDEEFLDLPHAGTIRRIYSIIDRLFWRFDRPEGLDDNGNKAYDIVMKVLKEHDLLKDDEGPRVFNSPFYLKMKSASNEPDLVLTVRCWFDSDAIESMLKEAGFRCEFVDKNFGMNYCKVYSCPVIDSDKIKAIIDIAMKIPSVIEGDNTKVGFIVLDH